MKKDISTVFREFAKNSDPFLFSHDSNKYLKNILDEILNSSNNYVYIYCSNLDNMDFSNLKMNVELKILFNQNPTQTDPDIQKILIKRNRNKNIECKYITNSINFNFGGNSESYFIVSDDKMFRIEIIEGDKYSSFGSFNNNETSNKLSSIFIESYKNSIDV